MSEVLKKIGEMGIVPVIKIEDAGDAVPLCNALKEGGLPIAEITFRTKAAKAAIENVTRDLPDVLTGAGTVLTVEQAQQAVDAGAKFIVSPGFNPKVVQYCVDRQIPITPGCSTPSDIEAALEMGLDTVKFFPAEAAGGLSMLKAVSAPYGAMRFIPTGGINADNLGDYLAFNKVLACGGTWMVKSELIEEKNFDAICELTKKAVSAMLGFSLAHIGMNGQNEEESLAWAKKASALFGWPLKPGNSSNFAGSYIEANKKPGPGKNGHIAVATHSIERAVAYFDRLGIKTEEGSEKYKDGNMIAVYLKEDIGGFAIHLLQK